MRLCFYNPGNNGDIHVSRELVKYVMRVVDVKQYIYYHKNSSRIILDISKLETLPFAQAPFDLRIGEAAWKPDNETVVFNTWYAVSPTFKHKHCSLGSLYDLFRANLCSQFGHDLVAPISEFVPTIDFSYYETQGVRSFLDSASTYQKKVLICNGQPWSGQTKLPVQVFEAAVRDVVEKHKDVLFFITNRIDLKAPNVAYTSDIIGLPEGANDLCENGFLSTFCDIVVGLGSGAYTFSYLVDNFFDPNKKMLCFTIYENIARWLPVEIMKAFVIVSPAVKEAEVRGYLNGVLR